jgi:mRNA interferase MazF
MKRGDLVTVAVQGDFGKPRPALIVQSDLFNSSHASLTVLLIGSDIVAAPLFRIDVNPNAGNGLTQPSQIQVDKIMTVRREKLGPTIGRLDDEIMIAVNRALAVFLGFA